MENDMPAWRGRLPLRIVATIAVWGTFILGLVLPSGEGRTLCWGVALGIVIGLLISSVLGPERRD